MKRRILFCTVGSTPQVVTETAWALLNRTTPWVPTEVHIVTTTFSLERIRTALQQPTGQLAGVFGGVLPPVTIHLPRSDSQNGHALESPTRWENDKVSAENHTLIQDERLLRDINSEADAISMGNVIISLMSDFVSDDNSEIHLSLAGGRKTMSAHALLALTIQGRSQDEASHVLVSSKAGPQAVSGISPSNDFEDNPQFWYPTQGGLIHRRAELRLDVQKRPEPSLDPLDAVITLVPTPTPLMSYQIKEAAKQRSPKNQNGSKPFLLQDIIKQINAVSSFRKNPELTLDSQWNTVSFGGLKYDFPAKLFALYRLYAVCFKEQWRTSDLPNCTGWLSIQFIANENTPNGIPVVSLLIDFLEEANIAESKYPEKKRTKEDNTFTNDLPSKAAPESRLKHVRKYIGSNTKLNSAILSSFGSIPFDIMRVDSDEPKGAVGPLYGLNQKAIEPYMIKIV